MVLSHISLAYSVQRVSLLLDDVVGNANIILHILILPVVSLAMFMEWGSI